MDFSTKGMDYYEKIESYEKGNVVPLGTVCYRAGDFIENTIEVIVNKENQRLVSMLWNDGYYLSKDEADKEMNRSKSEYANYIYNSY